MNNRIEIIGLLGAGKTTLLNKIAEHNQTNIQFVYEELSPLNEVWDFFKKTNTNYFLLQTAYYIEAVNKIQKAINDTLIISDFSIRIHHYVYSYYLLKQNLIKQVEWNTLDKIFNLLSIQLPTIKGIIVIDATPNELLKNIHSRSRNLDADTKLPYLTALETCFNENKDKILYNIPTLTFNVSELMNFNQLVQKKLCDFFHTF